MTISSKKKNPPGTMKTTNTPFLAMHMVIFIPLMSLAPNVYSASINEVKTLRSNLLSDYDKCVRPVINQTESVKVRIALSMVALQEFDEVNEKFSFVGLFSIVWKDENLVWNVSNYSGINQLLMSYREVWVPEIILTNPSEKLDSYGDDWQMIRYSASGDAFWYPGTLIKATCSINAYYFPFDVQKCHVEVFVWAYSFFEVKLVNINDKVYTGLMPEHGSWSVIKTQAKIEDVGYSSKGSFIFWFERKPQYVIVNVLLPVLFLCLLNVLVFLLPAESGERVSYSITVLLSIAVFMTIVSDTLPKTSEPLPIISYFLMISLIESAVITIATMLNLRLYHKDNNEVVPEWLACICLRLKRLCTGSRRMSHTEQTAVEGNFPTPLNALALGTSNKVGLLEPKLQEMIVSFCREDRISWKDVSVLVDFLLLGVSASVTLISFAVFMIITKTG